MREDCKHFAFITKNHFLFSAKDWALRILSRKEAGMMVSAQEGLLTKGCEFGKEEKGKV